MRKFTFFFITLLLICILLCSCAELPYTEKNDLTNQGTECSDVTNEKENHPNQNIQAYNWNILTDAYSLIENNGEFHLVFHDTHRATEEQINACYLADVYFDSFEDMRRSFVHNDFTEQEQIVMQASFQRDAQGIRLCNLNELWDAQKPATTQITRIGLTGEYYDIYITEEGVFNFGWICYSSENNVNKLKERDYIKYDSSYRTVTRQETTTFDGVPCEIVESNSQYEYYRDIYIDIKDVEKNISMVVRYLLNYTKGDGKKIPSETAPAYVLMYGEQNGVHFHIGLYEFSESPTYEWLSSFGLTPYVPSANDNLATE